MLNLILAIASSALVSIIMRFSGSKIKNNLSMLAVNYIMCAWLAGYLGGITGLPEGTGRAATLVMGGVNGVLYLSGFVLLQRNIRENGVVLSATFIGGSHCADELPSRGREGRQHGGTASAASGRWRRRCHEQDF